MTVGMPDVLIATPTEDGSKRLGANVFRKHLLPYGTWLRPGSQDERFEVTPKVVETMVENFNRGILDFVPTPSHHTDDWEANKGEVIGLEAHPEKGLFATIKVADEETGQALASGKLRGISAMFSENYLDKKSGKHVGPVLRHAAFTNVPYIKGMGPFEAVLSEAGLLSDDDVLVSLSEPMPLSTTTPPKGGATLTLDELKAMLRDKHDIDLDVVLPAAQRAQAFDAGIASLREAGISLSEDASAEDVVQVVTGLHKQVSAAKDAEGALSNKVTALSDEVATLTGSLKRKEAESLVAPYLANGAVKVADKDMFVSLAETQPEVAKVMLSKLPADVTLSERGTEDGGPDGGGSDDVDEEIARLRKVAAGSGLRVRKGVEA